MTASADRQAFYRIGRRSSERAATSTVDDDTLLDQPATVHPRPMGDVAQGLPVYGLPRWRLFAGVRLDSRTRRGYTLADRSSPDGDRIVRAAMEKTGRLRDAGRPGTPAKASGEESGQAEGAQAGRGEERGGGRAAKLAGVDSNRGDLAAL